MIWYIIADYGIVLNLNIFHFLKKNHQPLFWTTDSRAVTKYRSILSLEFEQIKFSILLYDEMWGAINNLNFVAAAQNIAGNIAGQVNEQIAICLLFTFKRLAAAVRLVQ